MTRIFPAYAYGAGPRETCWWDETIDGLENPKLTSEIKADVVIVGAGYTGLSAARHFAEAGLKTVVLESNFPGWGASGRNGGFCCLGGGIAEDDVLDRQFGREGRLAYRVAERSAVELVDQLILDHDMNVDRHSRGETELAHRPKDMNYLRAKAKSISENYGVSPELIEQDQLATNGMSGPFYGALTVPLGFGLNPRKYLVGLMAATKKAGGSIFNRSKVNHVFRDGAKWVVRSEQGSVKADHVVFATNGYSSEDLPPWLASRYIPGQSTVLVTRPLTDSELDAALWTSDQMVYDTRQLLHYFRLMPDRRMLFGMRGGLLSGVGAERRARANVLRHFRNMFPAWAHVDTPYVWSGMVCLARDRLPFVGAIPKQPGLWAAMCYHGNGVAMGTFAGQQLSELVLGRCAPNLPEAMRRPLSRFPFGKARRVIMPPIYAGLMLSDR